MLTTDQEARESTEAAASAPAAGAGLSSFLNKRRTSTESSVVEEPIAPAALPADNSPVANDPESQNSPKPIAESLIDNQAASEIAMDVDPIAANAPQEDLKGMESTLTDTTGIAPNETNHPIATEVVDHIAQESPKVPESISPEGQEDVQDDLTATSYYSVKDSVTGDNEEKSAAAPGTDWNTKDKADAVADMPATKAPEATVEQSAVKTMNAPRVSLSPPTQSKVPKAVSNQTDTDVEKFNLGDTANQVDGTLGSAMDSTMADSVSVGLINSNDQYMESYVAPNNGTDMDVNMDDDNSIIIPLPPGCDASVNNQTTFPTPESIHVAQYGTDAITGLDTSMELTAPLNGAEGSHGTNLAGGETEKQSVPSRNVNSTPSQITGLNAYVAGDQKPPANVSKGSLVNRSASSRFGARSAQGLNNSNKTRPPFSLARARASTNTAGRQNQSNLGTTKLAAARNYSKTVTPPGRGRNLNPNAGNAQSRPGSDCNMEKNTAVTPEVTAQNRIRPSAPMQAREMQKQPAVEETTDMSVELEHNAPGNDATISPLPPATTNHTNSTTPKMSNAKNVHHEPNQLKDTQWNLSIGAPSSSNLSFDELLNQFLQDIQEATDLHEQGENEMLNLQVDLSHAVASALRYKGDMMDLLDEIGDTKANAQRVLAHFAE